MPEEWFKWEREGALHPMFFPMEAAFAPFEKYSGKQWPDTIMIFKGDIVLWCNRMRELYDLGQELIDGLLDETKKEKMLADLEIETEKMKSVIEKIKKTKMNVLDDSALLHNYEELRAQFYEWFAIGWLVEPVYLQGEQLILKKTKPTYPSSILPPKNCQGFSGTNSLAQVRQIKPTTLIVIENHFKYGHYRFHDASFFLCRGRAFNPNFL